MNDRHDAVTELAAGFVLGALTPAEEALVREHLASCGEPHPEYAELGGVVPYLLDTVELVEPPASLRDRIMAAAAADLAARQGGAVPAAPPAAERGDPEPGRIAGFPSAAARAERAERAERAGRERARSPLAWVAGLAAAIAIVALGAWNVTLQRDLEGARSYERGLSAVLDVAGRPGSRAAILEAQTGGGPSGLAAVAPDGTVTIVMRGLAATSGTEVYEAWVIGPDQTPVAIGGFQVGPTGTATFTASGTPARAGVAVALTREPRPGATTPTAPILSLGTTPGS